MAAIWDESARCRAVLEYSLYEAFLRRGGVGEIGQKDRRHLFRFVVATVLAEGRLQSFPGLVRLKHAPNDNFPRRHARLALHSMILARPWLPNAARLPIMQFLATINPVEASYLENPSYNQRLPHSALGGQPPAVAYWQNIETNQPDQQMQRVA